jgi:energy-coupling factor transporter ATP-binding protein EcfA2
MSAMKREALNKLRLAINENLRVQRGGAKPVPFIDVSNVLNDVAARQNHAIFGRRGCGKTLLLHHSATLLQEDIRTVYLNCEDFKKHSFPNVLIEILDAVFAELQSKLTGWFGRKKKSRDLIVSIRGELQRLRSRADLQETQIREAQANEVRDSQTAELRLGSPGLGLTAGEELGESTKVETERKYLLNQDKVRDLDVWLPRLKQQIREFFGLSSSVKAIFLEIDDFYHLSRTDQPLVMDYVHRLCKDLPLYFKVATLRHASTLYADRLGQPIGAQERHDYQPINIDFTFADFKKTVNQNRDIFHEFGRRADLKPREMDDLFKGEGFARLVLAGGGVPRDCLSLFLEVLESVQPPSGDGRIGKDDVRILSRANFERRIEELKQDSEGREQGILIRGIYVLRQFCIDKKSSVLLVSEALLQQDSRVRNLLYRLLDYRIMHSAGSALTHKSQPGTYQAFAIDIGCYAHMRKLQGRLTEIDLSAVDAKEKMRSGPILDGNAFNTLWEAAPADPETALREQEAQ